MSTWLKYFKHNLSAIYPTLEDLQNHTFENEAFVDGKLVKDATFDDFQDVSWANTAKSASPSFSNVSKSAAPTFTNQSKS